MFILSLEVLRQRLVTDMTYIKQVDVGLLIVSFSAQLWFRSGSLNVEIKGGAEAFSISSDQQDMIARLMEAT